MIDRALTYTEEPLRLLGCASAKQPVGVADGQPKLLLYEILANVNPPPHGSLGVFTRLHTQQKPARKKAKVNPWPGPEGSKHSSHSTSS